jgi:hypothetical protein
MSTVVISKIEYQNLKKQARAYRDIMTKLHKSVVRDSVDSVAADFKATGLYSAEFLKDLKTGLKKSSYSK